MMCAAFCSGDPGNPSKSVSGCLFWRWQEVPWFLQGTSILNAKGKLQMEPEMKDVIERKFEERSGSFARFLDSLKAARSLDLAADFVGMINQAVACLDQNDPETARRWMEGLRKVVGYAAEHLNPHHKMRKEMMEWVSHLHQIAELQLEIAQLKRDHQKEIVAEGELLVVQQYMDAMTSDLAA
jgi:hypothetical protein